MKSESVVMRNYDNLHVEPKLVSVGVAMRTVKSSAFEFGRRKRLLHFLRLSKLARLLVCFNPFCVVDSRSTADRMSAYRKLDRHCDDLCAGALS